MQAFLEPLWSFTTPSPSTRMQALILLAVFLDLVGVALVVPNLVFRWKDVGITPEGLGAVQSIYSGAQLVGGLILGHVGDRLLGRKRVLLLSFAGACVSYLLVGLADSIWLLVLSRVVVGLVKQTMTVSSALLTRSSAPTHIAVRSAPTAYGRATVAARATAAGNSAASALHSDVASDAPPPM